MKMKINKKRLIIIIISVLVVVVSLLYLKGNEYRKIAWNTLDKKEQKNVIGGRFLSYTKTIKVKNEFVVPDDCSFIANNYVYDKALGTYIAKDEMMLFFKDNVPDYIAKLKIALMDGVITDDLGRGMYSIRIDGIGCKKLDKLADKLSNNDPYVSCASENYVCYPQVENYNRQIIKNAEIEAVTFYYFRKNKIYHYTILILKNSNKKYFIDSY